MAFDDSMAEFDSTPEKERQKQREKGKREREID